MRNLTLAAVLLAPFSVTAQELPVAPYLPLEMATSAAQAAVKACAPSGSIDATCARAGLDQIGAD